MAVFLIVRQRIATQCTDTAGVPLKIVYVTESQTFKLPMQERVQ